MTTSDRPIFRGWSHHFAFFVAAGAGLVLVAMSRTPQVAAAVAVYAASLAAMFGISAAYHRGAWGPRARAIWRRADHATIFLFVAGTYTPICLLAIGGPVGWRLLAIVWGGAALGALQAIAWVRAPRVITAALYVALGWALVAYWDDVTAGLAVAPRVLLVAGGALYTAGAVVYALRRPDPSPRVFGYHEVFHAFVIAASVCHFAAVVLVVRGA
jgi:hemolysin III